MKRGPLRPVAAPRAVIPVRLPVPEPVRFEVELPAGSELIVRAPEGLEVCAGGRGGDGSYRLWVRKKGRA